MSLPIVSSRIFALTVSSLFGRSQSSGIDVSGRRSGLVKVSGAALGCASLSAATTSSGLLKSIDDVLFLIFGKFSAFCTCNRPSVSIFTLAKRPGFEEIECHRSIVSIILDKTSTEAGLFVELNADTIDFRRFNCLLRPRRVWFNADSSIDGAACPSRLRPPGSSSNAPDSLSSEKYSKPSSSSKILKRGIIVSAGFSPDDGTVAAVLDDAADVAKDERVIIDDK